MDLKNRLRYAKNIRNRLKRAFDRLEFTGYLRRRDRLDMMVENTKVVIPLIGIPKCKEGSLIYEPKLANLIYKNAHKGPGFVKIKGSLYGYDKSGHGKTIEFTTIKEDIKVVIYIALPMQWGLLQFYHTGPHSFTKVVYGSWRRQGWTSVNGCLQKLERKDDHILGAKFDVGTRLGAKEEDFVWKFSRVAPVDPKKRSDVESIYLFNIKFSKNNGVGKKVLSKNLGRFTSNWG